MTDSRDTPRRLFESFNARFLSAEEIANTFIPPAQYRQLLDPNHSILLGPRGSGKTTLLKMLQLRAMAAWDHPAALEARELLSFHSIFLGTDVLWGSQLESRTKAIQDEEKRSQIRRTSFRLHMALALLDAIEECGHESVRRSAPLERFHVDLSREMNSEIAISLAYLWDIKLPSASLFGLRVGLRKQLSDLLTHTGALRQNQKVQTPEFALLDPIPSITGAIDLVNSIFQQPNRRWALLCDELEIAPKIIRSELFSLLRSTSKYVLFKLSIYPHSTELAEIGGPSDPSVNNDYFPLNLSYGHRESSYSFCRSLFTGMLERLGGSPATEPEEILGEGWFDGGRSRRRYKVSPYSPPHGEYYRRALLLTRVDPSFRYFLKQKRFDISTIHTLEEPVQARYRKALPFILTRSEFLRNENARRSRKASRLYTGAYSLFSISEGNPRIFINLMRPLIIDYVARKGVIPSELQVAAADTTIHRFKASLAAIPSAPYEDIRSVLDVIEVVGRHFEIATLDESFNAEPATTFTVDEAVPAALLELVGRAVNSGAFIVIPDEGKAGVTSLSGARLRLAYTLAPDFKLPLVLGRPVNLSTILGAFQASKRRDKSVTAQSRLPFGAE